MCAHIGQKRHIYPSSIYGVHFRLVPPSPLLRRLTVGAAIPKNFFYFYFLNFRSLFLPLNNFLFFSFLLFDFYSYFIFFIFSIPLSTRSDYTLILVLYSFDFDLEFTSSRLRFSTLIIILDSVFFASDFRIVFTRIKLCRFYSSTLYLFCLL